MSIPKKEHCFLEKLVSSGDRLYYSSQPTLIEFFFTEHSKSYRSPEIQNNQGKMAISRGIARSMLLLSLLVALSTTNVAAARSFGNLFNGAFSQIQSMIDKIRDDAEKRLSVLSNFFGDGKTRADLSLPEIFNEVFSRNNSIALNQNMSSTDWELGDGSTVIAASTGGGISVTSNNGHVTISTAHQKPASQDETSSNENEGSSDSGNSPSDSENIDNSTPATADPVDQPVSSSEPEDMTFSGSNLDEAFIELMSDWDSFVTSSIWDVQDEDNSTMTEATSRIINGVFLANRIASGAPFAVKFFYNDEENYYCSGNLIGYPYALTAAHCGVVLGDEVRVGGRLLRSGYKAKVAEVIIHPDFNPASLVHDMAIVRLEALESKEVLNENGVEAAHLNVNGSFPHVDFVGVVSAHGSVETDGKGVSNELVSTRHTIYDLEKCRNEITQGDVQESDGFLCAGDGQRSTTCVGDSGAGLWHYRVVTSSSGETKRFYEIFGIVSFGEVTDDALCPRGPPTVFQRTATNYEWISKVVGEENMAS